MNRIRAGLLAFSVVTTLAAGVPAATASEGVVIQAGIMIVLINLAIDILYAYIDPRIRLTR